MLAKMVKSFFVAVVIAALLAVPAFAQVMHWKDTGVVSCGGDVNWQVVDVRRTKTVYRKNKAIHAQGEFLLVYLETHNMTDGDMYWESATVVGKKVAVDASKYAAWMYTGGTNTLWHPIKSGEKLTVVGAFDVAPDVHDYQFTVCGDVVNIGSWFELEKGTRKANS